MTIEPIVTCPDKIELGAFAAGELTELRLEQLAKHIDKCTSCGIVVDDVSKHHESGLIAELRSMNVESTYLRVKNRKRGREVPEALLKAAYDAADLSSIPVSSTSTSTSTSIHIAGHDSGFKFKFEFKFKLRTEWFRQY